MKQNSKIISNVAYHGDLEKKAAMEKQREVAEIADNRGNITDVCVCVLLGLYRKITVFRIRRYALPHSVNRTYTNTNIFLLIISTHNCFCNGNIYIFSW